MDGNTLGRWCGLGCVGAEPAPDVAGVVNRTRRYRITGRTLELLGGRGRTLAVLRRR